MQKSVINTNAALFIDFGNLPGMVMCSTIIVFRNWYVGRAQTMFLDDVGYKCYDLK